MRTDEERDTILDEHTGQIAELYELSTKGDGRTSVLEGRIGSYADAELAYRRATEAVEAQRAAYANDHARAVNEQREENRQMLDSAKRILDGAVAAAIDQFKAPLATVQDIRDAQTERHARELVLAEQRTESVVRRNHALRVAGAATAAALSLAAVLSAVAELLKSIR